MHSSVTNPYVRVDEADDSKRDTPFCRRNGPGVGSHVGMIRQKTDHDGGDDVVLEREPKVARARRWCVFFYNDDYTTKWLVVHVLEQFFHMGSPVASACSRRQDAYARKVRA
jgi:hypothetical protein